MKQYSKQGTIIVIVICLFFPWYNLFAGTDTPQEKYQFTEKFKVGVEEASETKDQPYQFSLINSIECDKNGNFYVLDSKDKCVKKFAPNGTFMELLIQSGKGPKEASTPSNLSINQYTDHIFVLQDHGLTMKEFDMKGNGIKYFVLPKQFYGNFYFVNKDEFVYTNMTPYKDEFNNFIKLNVPQKKIVQEFALIEMNSDLNYKQRFAISGNSTLWTSRGHEMKLLAFDLKSGKQIQEIPIPGTFKKNIVVESVTANGMQMITPILYNLAQPFIINDQLFALVIIQEFQTKDGKIDSFPITFERIIYQVNGSNFQKMGVLKDSENIFLGTVHKNRLILFSNEPYGHFRVFEFNKIGSSHIKNIVTVQPIGNR